MMRRSIGIPIGLLFIIALLLILAAFRRVSAQDTGVYSWLRFGCQEFLDNTHYRIHFGYESNGVETYAVTFENTNGGASFITAPALFTTQAGVFDNEWYQDGQLADIGFTFYVVFSNENRTHTLPLQSWITPMCEDSPYKPVPPPAPEATQDAPGGLLWAWDSGAGRNYSYAPQTGGIVPLPPVSEVQS